LKPEENSKTPKIPVQQRVIQIILLNVVIFLFLIGVFFIHTTSPYEPLLIHYYTLVYVLSWMIFIPFIGRFYVSIKNLKYLGIIVFIGKFIAIYIMQSFGFFLGDFDRRIFTENAILYLQGSRATYIMGDGSLIEVNYPPGTSYMWLFLLVINPLKNPLLFRVYLLFFEAGIQYMVYKIATIKTLGISAQTTSKGIVYLFFSFTYLGAFDIYGKPDCIVALLALIGYYLLLKKKLVISAAVLTLAGFIKLYTFIWLLGFFIIFLKRRDFKSIILLLIGISITSAIVLPIDYYFQQWYFFKSILKFNPQLSQAYEIYYLNVWFYLVYFHVPMSSLIPYSLMFVSYLVFCLNWKKEFTPEFITTSIAITLFFYTSINVQYFHWMIAFICIGLLGSEKKMRFLALLISLSFALEICFILYLAFQGKYIRAELLVSLDEPPPVDYLIWRFASLGLFLFALLILILPKRFERFFPRHAYMHPELTIKT